MVLTNSTYFWFSVGPSDRSRKWGMTHPHGGDFLVFRRLVDINWRAPDQLQRFAIPLHHAAPLPIDLKSESNSFFAHFLTVLEDTWMYSLHAKYPSPKWRAYFVFLSLRVNSISWFQLYLGDFLISLSLSRLYRRDLFQPRDRGSWKLFSGVEISWKLER